MKTLLFISLLVFVSCAQNESSNETTLKGEQIAMQNEIKADSLNLNITTDFVTGQFDFRSHEDFKKVAAKYANDDDTYLHKKTYMAFKKMYESALEDGVKLIIVSGARNFRDQKAIWEGKWQRFEAPSPLKKALKILNYSSMPMTSRHHWGTDIDLNNLNNDYFESGEGKEIYDWLKTNANKFGFYQPYTDKSLNNRTGYNMEKWHWSYLPLADKYLEFYNEHITNEDITGFKGSELAAEIDMAENYVNGLSVKVKEYE